MFPGSRRAGPHVVIVGGGFGGLEAARGLAGSPVRLTLIDGAADFVFRPLLSQLLAGRVEAASVAHPYPEIVQSLPGTTFHRGRLEGIERAARRVLVSGRPISYDYLLLGTGAPDTPGSLVRERGALRLETLADWRRLDRALVELSRVGPVGGRGHRGRGLVVVGGGPHGVELAAAAKMRLEAIVRRGSPIGRTEVRVLLAHEGARLLETYPEAAARHAARSLAGLGVEVVLNQRVGEGRGALPTLDPTTAATLVWAGGRQRPRLDEIPGLGTARLAADLSIEGSPEIIALGDLAAANARSPIPALASAAMQTGRHAARVVHSDLSRGARPPFSFVDDGYGTYLGPNDAVVVLGGQVLTGAAACAAKLTLHLALSTTSSMSSAASARRRSAEAMKRRLVGPRARGLVALERTPPDAGRATNEVRLESRVVGRAPAHVFEVAVARIDELFSRIDARVLERVVTPDGHVRMRLQLGGWRALRGPIEVAFDPARHALVITTLATHPLRARATVELRPERRGTVISQINRYQLGVAFTLVGQSLGLDGKVNAFWRGFHDALRDAATSSASPPRGQTARSAARPRPGAG